MEDTAMDVDGDNRNSNSGSGRRNERNERSERSERGSSGRNRDQHKPSGGVSKRLGKRVGPSQTMSNFAQSFVQTPTMYTTNAAAAATAAGAAGVHPMGGMMPVYAGMNPWTIAPTAIQLPTGASTLGRGIVLEGLRRSVTAEVVEKTLSEAGSIDNVNIRKNQIGKSIGVADIIFTNSNDASTAIQLFDGTVVPDFSNFAVTLRFPSPQETALGFGQLAGPTALVGLHSGFVAQRGIEAPRIMVPAAATSSLRRHPHQQRSNNRRNYSNNNSSSSGGRSHPSRGRRNERHQSNEKESKTAEQLDMDLDDYFKTRDGTKTDS
ncbi:hypothetical protein GQ42DRAFT_159777 [Ramicandelaber brevisporus]|nr:hypothetical protein GQ42DRAFT_159777 [Ramicandelaber brevisporus]